MSETEERLRPYEGWWFRQVIDSKEKDKKLDEWHPFLAIDNDNLERGLTDSSTCQFENEVIVHDRNKQPVSIVSLNKMTVRPLYWVGAETPVRRSIWMQMNSLTEDAEGGRPVPPEWDKLLEKAYIECREWVTDAPIDHGNVVEKIIQMSDSLQSYMLILRRGHPDSAKLVLKKSIEQKTLFFGSGSSIRLIRGYIPFYISVASAAQISESSGSKEHLPPVLSLPSPFDPTTISNDIRMSPPKHLIFAVHGIGQKFAGRLGSNFIDDCENLRCKLSEAITERGGNTDDILLIPVNWRLGLKMGIKSWFPECGEDVEESFEALVQRITLETVPMIRDAVSDVGLDILLYMTPAYFQRIISSALNEIKRQYDIFLKTYGDESASSTKISIVGHSLGSAIVCDFISFVAKDDSEDTLKKCAHSVCSNLGFTVDKFFAIGSPLSLFFLLKQLRPRSCLSSIHDWNLLLTSGADASQNVEENVVLWSRKPSAPNIDNGHNLYPRDLYFACKEVYNIFHPYDPIAYRLEPLIIPPSKMPQYSLPVKIPYFKKGAMKMKLQMEEGIQGLKERAAKAKEDLVNSMSIAIPDWLKTSLTSLIIDSPKMVEAGTVPPIAPDSAPLSRFNRHGRLDFTLQEALFENSYLSALTAHINYWEDIDVAAFLTVELLGLPKNPR